MALERDRLLKRVTKLRKLIHKLDSNPAPEKVHDLRTTARQFEAIFHALSLDEHGARKSMLKDLAHIRKRAGKVRDMDVLMGFASKIHPPGEEECSLELLEYIGAERMKQAKKLHREVSKRSPALRRDLKRTISVLAKLLPKRKSASNGSATAADATATAVKLASGLATPERLTRETLHPYRLKVKELRNVLRMADRASSTRFVEDLGKVQDAIGEWHDWDELVSMAERLEPGKKCLLRIELRHIATRKYAHALALSRKLRKAYLRSTRGSSRAPTKRSAASTKIPRPLVWEATTLLAG
jgi:CHAD domain-containing protein